MSPFGEVWYQFALACPEGILKGHDDEVGWRYLCMVLIKLHDAAGGPKKRRICRRFVVTRDESAGFAGAG